MTRPVRPPRRRAPLAALAASVLLLASTTACAQGSGPGTSGTQAAAGLPSQDSVLARAERDRIHGQQSAPVTIIEISDFQCPFCGRFARETYPKLDSAYVKTGKVRMVFINYPLPNHRQAWAASEAAMCAAAQGAFWPMHDRLFATQSEWNGQPDAAQRFERLAGALKLNLDAYRACTQGDLVSPIILTDVMQASAAGVNGTPTFIINGNKVLSGAIPFEDLKREIDAQLAAPAGPAQGAPPAPPAGGAPAPARP